MNQEEYATQVRPAPTTEDRPMIDVYFWPKPKGRHAHISLDGCALPYREIPVEIGIGTRFKHNFLVTRPDIRSFKASHRTR